jgi:hypothetical protein
MAPIVLKVKGNNHLLPFNNLDSDDLSKTWRVCTKVKDSLENGSRLENLSWRLWFSHNVNNAASAKTKKPACKASSPVLRNFKVPDDFDFQSQKSPTPKKKVNGKQAATSQPKKKQPTQKLQINTNMDTDTDNSFTVQGSYHQSQQPQPQQPQQQQQHQHYQQHQQHYHQEVHQQQKPQQHEHYHHQQHHNTNQQQQTDLNTRNGNTREEFTLHQYTSDQAGDQVVELEDIFGTFGDIQAYIDSSGNIISSTTTPTIVSNNSNTAVTAVTSDGVTNDTLITGNTWDMSQQDTLYQQQQQYYPTQQPMNSTATTPIHVSFDDANAANYNASQYYNYPYYDDNGPVDANNLNSALYVSSDTMPPIPIGTLHNKLLATLPRETLESAEKLFTGGEDHNTQSTPTTPYITPVYHQYETEPMEKEDSFDFMMLQYARPQQPATSSFQSKSLPPSRATSPPPMPKRNMNGSASDGKAAVCSNCSTTSTPLWRRSANDELLCNACGL